MNMQISPEAAIAQLGPAVENAAPVERLEVLRRGAHRLIRYVQQGSLSRQQVEEEIARVANEVDRRQKWRHSEATQIFELLGQAAGEIALPDADRDPIELMEAAELQAPYDPADELVDESEPNEPMPAIPSAAREALDSWDRTLGNLEDPEQHRGRKYMDAAKEIWALRARSTPAVAQQLSDEIIAMGVRHGIPEVAAVSLLRKVTAPPALDAPIRDAYAQAPVWDERVPPEWRDESSVPPQPLQTVTPLDWKGTEAPAQRWLASGRIPAGDLTILSGNGGAGKSEIAVGLAVAVAAGLGDWLGSVVESGPALFFSGEEDEGNVRDRVERICRHRGLDPHGLADLHLLFPDLDATWLCSVNQRTGQITKAPLLVQLETWIAQHRPALVVIDSVAAVFDGDAIARRQVRAFLAMLRKIARDTGTAIVLLDHPSVRGMADGTGTANSVDWRNSVRSMLHLSDPDNDDPDSRTLEVKKSNRGRTGEKTELRWNGLTFTTGAAGVSSPHRAAAERHVDELFLRLLDERTAQGRPVTPSRASGFAPKEFAAMPAASGVSVAALSAAMERLLTAKVIVAEEYGPPSKRRQRLMRSLPTTLPTA